MPQLEQITIAPGLTFDVLAAGEAGAPLVVLLHGFAKSMHCWNAQVAVLANTGYRAVAPSQRGYSPGARPDLDDSLNYHIDRLMDDAMAIAGASGYGDARFHLVGHDWGGSIAWSLADRYPQRLPRSRCCRGPIPTLSIARCRCLTGNRRAVRGITRRSWIRMRPTSSLPTTPNGCASGFLQTAFRPRRSSGIFRYLATSPRWKRRWRGIARAARSAVRSA